MSESSHIVSYTTAQKVAHSVCSRILRVGSAITIEEIPLEKAAGRILAENFYAKFDVPPFDNSSMDGFALRSRDITSVPTRLKIVGTLPAGTYSATRIKKGECVRIMTGSMMPEGADAVVMKEFTKVDDKKEVVDIFVKPVVGSNVRYKGEDLKKGRLLIAKGERLSPFMLGLVASQGVGMVKVLKKPIVGFITTGNEIVMPSRVSGANEKKQLLHGKIYNVNRYTMEAALNDAGCEPLYLGHSTDDIRALKRIIEKNFPRIDALVTIGGVSMGEYDLVKDCLKSLGARFYFEKVFMKPGRPTGLSVLKNKPIFTLPGNVVSSLVAFEFIVRPALTHYISTPSVFTIKNVSSDFEYAKDDKRTHILRVRVYQDTRKGDFCAKLSGGQGSGILSTLSLSNGYVILPEGKRGLIKGEKIDVLIPHLFLNFSLWL